MSVDATFELGEIVPHRDITGEIPDNGLNVALHPGTGGRLVVMHPGYGGSVAGSGSKNIRLASYLHHHQLGSIVRTDNPGDYAGVPEEYQQRALHRITHVIDQLIKDAQHFVADTTHLEIDVVGSSAGGGALAAVAYQFPQIKRMLLFYPSLDVGETAVFDGLREFTGQLSIITGQLDQICPPRALTGLLTASAKASTRQALVIRGANHGFENAGKEGELRIKALGCLWGLTDEGGHSLDEFILEP